MEILLTSLIAFISTNLDDIFLLMVFYGNGRFKNHSIIAGQYLGIIFLIAISLAGSLIGLVLDKSYIGLLGLFPVYLGLKGILELVNNKASEDEEEKIGPSPVRGAAVAIAIVTIANGGDNIGIYVPLFAALSWINKMIMIFVFLVMTAVWCKLAHYLARHHYVARIIERYGHIIAPFVLIALGFFILYESGTLNMLIGLL